MSVLILGAGAFGTALAVALAQEGPVRLWARDGRTLATTRESTRLPGVTLPAAVSIADSPAPHRDDTAILIAVPMTALGAFLADHGAALDGRILVACCKGIDRATMQGPTALIAAACPRATVAIITGPSFATDIARGLPTALTLACTEATAGARLQADLSTSTLRLYRSTDVIGAELGGALKNVVAIAAGIVIGAGLGQSARAALMTRGYAEMSRLARHLGAKPETLAGLSGLGDLVLTCTSDQSRNFRHGVTLGAGGDPGEGVTVEGVATARAVARLAETLDVELPIASMVAAVVEGRRTVPEAIRALMSRPLREE